MASAPQSALATALLLALLLVGTSSQQVELFEASKVGAAQEPLSLGDASGPEAAAGRGPGPLLFDPAQQGLSDGDVYRCSTPVLSAAQKARSERFIQSALSARVEAGDTAIPAGLIDIGVYFHIILDSTGKGNVSNSAINSQMQVLNAAYSGHFTFTLLGVDRTVNNQWAVMAPGSAEEQQAKKALRKGTKQHLNLYTAQLAGKLLGWAYFPSTIGTSNLWLDGVVCLHSSLPGGDKVPYNLGDTAVHEVGHFLGLYHTFEGGCSAQNDGIADTAPESDAAKGCPVGRDTCSGGGPDDIKNFMDYTADDCMDHFSNQQIIMMKKTWTAYRAGK